MKSWHWRYLILIGLTGVLVFLTGCGGGDEPEAELTSNEVTVQDSDPSKVTTEPDLSPSTMKTIMESVDRASIIAADGSEINVDQEALLAELQDALSTLTPFEQSISDFDYTLLLWSKEDQPTVLQVGTQGVKMGDQYYQGETLPLLRQLLEQSIGERFFANVTVDHMVASAYDLNQNRVLNPDEIMIITTAIKEASFLRHPPRITIPLFPAYVLELGIGGKQIIPVEIITPDLFRVDIGGNLAYYQLEQPAVYTILSSKIPSIDYSSNHIKSLFKADEMKIKDLQNLLPKTDIYIGGEGTDKLEVKSITDGFARLLADGIRKDIAFSQNSPSIVLEFMVENKGVAVEVYPDGFIFQNKSFAKVDILEEIVQRVKKRF